MAIATLLLVDNTELDPEDLVSDVFVKCSRTAHRCTGTSSSFVPSVTVCKYKFVMASSLSLPIPNISSINSMAEERFTRTDKHGARSKKYWVRKHVPSIWEEWAERRRGPQMGNRVNNSRPDTTCKRWLDCSFYHKVSMNLRRDLIIRQITRPAAFHASHHKVITAM
jgi:hypothetical protein